MNILTLTEFKNTLAQLPPSEAKDILSRARVYILRPKFDKCQACTAPTTGGKKYCNGSCKQKAWRSRRKLTGSPRANKP